MGRNKVLGSKVEAPCRVEGAPFPILAQPVHSREKSAVDARDDHHHLHRVSTSANKAVPNTEAVNAAAIAVVMPEKVKGSCSATDVLPKKKVKRKPESELNEGQQRPEKKNSTQAENKSQKPLPGPHVKTTFNPVT